MKSGLGLILHFAALLAASVGAYLVFQGPVEQQVKAIQILNVHMSDLDRLAFVSPAKTVEVKPRRSGGFTVEITENAKKPMSKDADPAVLDTDRDAGPAVLEKDTDTDAQADRKPDPKAAEKGPWSYRLSQVFEEKWKEFLPLLALRELGQIDRSEPGKFGFSPSGPKLVFKTASQEVVFSVGDHTFGGDAIYLRSEPNGPVYLVSSELLSAIDFGEPRFMERRLLGFDKSELEAILIESNAGVKELERRGAGNSTAWSVKGGRGGGSELLDNWINSLLRLGAKQYPPPAETTGIVPVASIEFKNRNGRLDTLELARASATSGKNLHYARTAFTGQWVDLESADAQTVVSDLTAILEQE